MYLSMHIQKTFVQNKKKKENRLIKNQQLHFELKKKIVLENIAYFPQKKSEENNK